MWTRKILVAYDGSAPSRRALELAAQVAGADPTVELVLAHVVRLFSSGAAAAGIDAVIMDDAASVRAELEAVAEMLPNPAEVRLLRGTSPADLIVSCAIEEGCAG